MYTLLLLKPDATRHSLANKILPYFTKEGFEVVKGKLLTADPTQVQAHLIDLKSRPVIFERNLKFYTSGPIVVYALSHPTLEDPTIKAREIQGATDPAKASKGTVRGDLATDNLETATSESRALENLIHTSDSLTTAAREIAIWFPELSN